jgi:thioredoxin reductase (NADPH)
MMALPEAGGAISACAATPCEALVIGAGPVGLWQVFQLGLQGISAHVVDALPEAGGQCVELYADKPIYDIPGVPVCSGRELVALLLRQIAPFAPTLHLGQLVSTLTVRGDGQFDVATSQGQRFITRSVFIAGGVGAFQPRLLKAEGIERFTGHQLFYRLPDAATLAGRQVLVLGGEDAAVQAALQLADALPGQAPADRPARITLMHRRATLTADSDSLARLQAHIAQGTVQFEVGQVLGTEASDGGPLTALQVIGDDSTPRRLPVDMVLAFLGVSPKLGPIADWGLALARRQLAVDAAHFETSTPGIFAVGDVVSYPGKKKLILCGFHEATLAAFAATARLRPDAPTLLQYTTTSPALHQRLGVATPARS